MVDRRSDHADTVMLLGDEGSAGCRDLRPISRTAHGVLYRAYHEHLDRNVALKVATTPVSGSRARAFRDRARAVEQIAGHPNVAGLLAWGLTDAGRPFTAREYFERGSLLDELNGSGPLQVADVLTIGVLMASALGSAHRLGVLHQNLVPQNILISELGAPLLADFAIAQGAAAAASPMHRAPEQLSGQAPSVAGDVYSLGSVLFHLLTGRPPYHDDGAGVASLLLRMLHDEPPRVVRADVPPAVAAVISRAMAVEPAARLADAFAVVGALRAVQAELGLAEPAGAEWQPVVVTGDDRQETTPPTFSADCGSGSGSGSDWTQTAVEPRRSLHRRRWPAAVGVGAAAVAAIGVPLAFGGSGRPAPKTGAPQPATSVASSPSSAAGANDATAGSAAPQVGPPSAVVAVDDGSAVSLRWTLPPGGDAFPVLVQTTPVGGAHPAPVPLAAGTRAYIATGLSSNAGYCFQAGLLLRFGDAARPPTEVWSAPTCVRGAVAAPANIANTANAGAPATPATSP